MRPASPYSRRGLHGLPGGGWQLVRRFASAREAVAAIEFAILVPVMLIIFLGLVEVSNGLSASRRVELIARTVADVSGQYKTLKNTEVADIARSAGPILHPVEPTNIQIRITSLGVNAALEVYVDWSETRDADGNLITWTKSPQLASCDAYTLPPEQSALKNAKSNWIMAEVVLPYSPPFKYVLKTDFDLPGKILMPPRATNDANTYKIKRDDNGVIKECAAKT